MDLFNEAKKYIPGGVNSPVRAFGAVGGDPLFIKEAYGSRLVDTDGNKYIDMISSWGPLILGHCRTEVIDAICSAAKKGTSFGSPTEYETAMAKLIVEMVPSVENVRMVNSGTEAVMSAIRLARGYTGKNKVIKFEGCYHGHSDSLLVKSGSGAITFNKPSSPGIPGSTTEHTIIAEYNNIETVVDALKKYKGDVACVIVEPVAGNMGVILPEQNFLRDLRELCNENACLLIFDEVITGFRLSPGGAQEYFDIYPDLTTLGKIIGGGLPVGAFGGKKDIMEYLAPDGPVYQAGTLSGNPLAMVAGITTLNILNNKDFYNSLNKKADKLWSGLANGIKESGNKCTLNNIATMGSIFFTDKPVNNYKDAMQSDTKLYAKYFHCMLEKGVYLAPSQYEAMFISSSHSDKDIKKIIDVNYSVLKNF